jgi:hypothetical protein
MAKSEMNPSFECVKTVERLTTFNRKLIRFLKV